MTDPQTIVRHVVPVDDMKPHDEGSFWCWCEPSIWRRGRLVVVTHQSADGRELIERHGVN